MTCFKSLHTLCSILREKDHKLENIDIAGNDLTAEHIQFIKMSLAANKSLVAIDLRRNPGYSAGNICSFMIFLMNNTKLFTLINN